MSVKMNSKFVSSIERSMFLIVCLISSIADLKSAPNQVEQVIDIINDINKLVTCLDGLVGLKKYNDSDQVFQDKSTSMFEEIYNTYLKIDDKIQQIKTLTFVRGPNVIQLISEVTLKEDINFMLDINSKLNMIEMRCRNYIYKIYNQIKNRRYESISSYISSIIDGDELKDRLTDVVKAAKLATIGDFYARKNIFEKFVAYCIFEKNYHRNCGDISAYDKLYNFYKYVIGTVSQGYALTTMAYQYRKLKSTELTVNDNNQLDYLNIYKQSIVDITESAKYYLDSINNVSNKSTVNCDPPIWKEGENYIRIKNYVSVCFEGFVAPHDDVVYDDKPEHECQEFVEYLPPFSLNYLKTIDCMVIFEPSLCTECPNKYYTEYSENNNRNLRRIWTNGYSSILKSYCDCDYNSDPLLSVRKLSLSLQICDNNKTEVVTGVRFHVQDGIIRIEIQCGALIKDQVDLNSVRWNTEERNYTRENHPNFIVLDSNLRSFNIDDILIPDGGFVTGVRFEKLANNHISLVVRGSEMSGRDNEITYSYKSQWYYPKNTWLRKSIDLLNLNSPLESNNQTYEISKSGRHYVNLTLAKRSAMYGNNTIVPFFDSQALISFPVVPFCGLGIFYKSQPSYGGFLTFKQISSEFRHFISN